MANKPLYDLIVLGAGPGGYVSAIRGAQLGFKVALVEKEKVGGVCLNRGCIPSKALIHNAHVVSLVRRAEEFGVSFDNVRFDFSVALKRSREAVDRLTKGVELLLKKHGVVLLAGTGELAGSKAVRVKTEKEPIQIEGQNIIIATGSRVKSLPGLPLDGSGIISSDEALWLSDLPGSLLIVGGGAVGVEFAYIFSAYGVKVTLVELEPRLLPGEDDEIGEGIGRAYSKMKIAVKTGIRIAGIEKEAAGYAVALKKGEKEETLRFDKILVAAGRAPNSENIGLESAGLRMRGNFIEADPLLRTSVPGIFAIGDVAGKSLLAHSAMAEGITAVETIAGKNPPPMDYGLVPSCVYGQPQVASFGLKERDAKKAGIPVRIGKFPYKANGKALAVAETEGFVKLVTHAETGELLGAHLLGADASEHISELVLARRMECTAGEIGRTIHPHPTLSEAIMEAAEDVFGKAIHIWKEKEG